MQGKWTSEQVKEQLIIKLIDYSGMIIQISGNVWLIIV
ncbi:hypothetical protein J2T20_002043 [Paenibacillus wynnii]|nr:hypothetical protein [Paenibacillus wynnii]